MSIELRGTTDLIIRQLGLVDYQQSWQAMLDFTHAREPDTIDELWLLQHPPVFTQGQAGKAEHLLNPGAIPVIQSDRGGQVTYHGPGQIIAYPLINLRRAKLGVRDLVTQIEKTVVDTLSAFNINSYPKSDAPGVYVEKDAREHKISSLGLRVRNGNSIHGLALNVAMDLSPFLAINPCGYAGLAMTQVKDCLSGESPSDCQLICQVQSKLIESFMANLRYNHASYSTELPVLP